MATLPGSPGPRPPRRLATGLGPGPREEFKREAIKLVTEQGLTIAEASKKLDTRWPKAIASKSLRAWMKQEQNGEIKASLGTNKLTADQLRIREIIGVWSALVPREKITPCITFYES